MYVILGAAGNVGHSTSSRLREAGAPVRAVLRDPSKAGRLAAIGCEIALADLQDPVALAQSLSGAHAVQVILPPPPRAADAVGEMRRAIESIGAALAQARPQLVLAISDYGAHVREWIGMPSVFRAFEDRLRELQIPGVILRSAEHMEGWAAFLAVVSATGALPSLHHPVEAKFPTISARELGEIAAELLLHPENGAMRIVHAEGPQRYSAVDVAIALSTLLGRAVTAQPLPRPTWQQVLEQVVSPSTAMLLMDLYDAHNTGGLVDVEPGGTVRCGTTELIDALRPLVRPA